VGAGRGRGAGEGLTTEEEGVGAHAARPYLGINTFLVGAQIITAIQSVVSRNVDQLKSAVVSICMFRAGTADNVIPQTVQLRGTARSFTSDIRDLLEKRLRILVENTAAAYRARAMLAYLRRLHELGNHDQQTELAELVA